MSDTQKPVLYLPTRVFLVPCDYDTSKAKKAELHRISFGARIDCPPDLRQMFFRREVSPK